MIKDQEPFFPENEESQEEAPTRVRIVPPFSEHPPCGMPGCGRMRTGKWAEPVFEIDIRPLARNWGGLDNYVASILICDRCYTHLGQLAEEAYMVEEQAALNSLTEE